MNKFIFTLVILSLLSLLSGCSTQSTDKNSVTSEMQRPSSAKMVFSHDVHKKAFDKMGFDCTTCHPMNIQAENKDELEIEQMIKNSEQSFFPGKETCHFCHYNTVSGNIAPGDCKICHINPRDVQPKNHNFNWMEKHAIFSKADQKTCENCHSQSFCNDCHKRRDIPTMRVHDRNFRFIHGIEARANPNSCGKCHQEQSFCQTCHIKGGYDY